MKNEFNITIKVADVGPMTLNIKRDEEPVIRTAEYRLNRLWAKWSQVYHDKNPHELLAMVAFQFAKSFVALSERSEEAERMIASFESEIDKILLDMDGDATRKNADGGGEQIQGTLF